jgi:hypothetical protein
MTVAVSLGTGLEHAETCWRSSPRVLEEREHVGELERVASLRPGVPGSRRRGGKIVITGTLLAASAFGATALGTAWAPSNALIFLVIGVLGGASFAPHLLHARRPLPFELADVGPAGAGAALHFLMLLGLVVGFLLPVVSGAMAQSTGSPAALAALAVVHLLVVVPALGLLPR